MTEKHANIYDEIRKIKNMQSLNNNELEITNIIEEKLKNMTEFDKRQLLNSIDEETLLKIKTAISNIPR